MKLFTTLFIFQFIIGQDFSQSYNPSGQLFWEISYNNKKSYLWGTIHFNDKRLFDFPDSVYVALNNCSMVAVETDFFKCEELNDVRIEEGVLALDKKGKLYTSSNEPTKTFFGNEDGQAQFMDAWIQSKAYQMDKPINGLLGQDIYKNYWESRIFPNTKNNLLGLNETQVLLNFYLQGNLNKLEAILFRNQVLGEFKEDVFNKNEALISAILIKVKQGGFFIGLGVESLIGEEGLLEKLKRNGIKIRPIKCTYSSGLCAEKHTINSIKQYELLCETYPGWLKAVFPGKPLLSVQKTREMDIEFKELGQGNVFHIQILDKDSSTTLAQYAAIHIASPPYSPYFLGTLEDGTEYAQGISDSYPDGQKWIRIICNESKVAVISCIGGNKFMNSDRPARFFNNVVLE